MYSALRIAKKNFILLVFAVALVLHPLSALQGTLESLGLASDAQGSFGVSADRPISYLTLVRGELEDAICDNGAFAKITSESFQKSNPSKITLSKLMLQEAGIVLLLLLAYLSHAAFSFGNAECGISSIIHFIQLSDGKK